jgi:hypothetical protein
MVPSSSFTYITQNIDSDDIMMNVRTVTDLPCCSCEDMCNNPLTCECLKYGRSYSYQKTLITRYNDNPIVECNLKCNCSFR